MKHDELEEGTVKAEELLHLLAPFYLDNERCLDLKTANYLSSFD